MKLIDKDEVIKVIQPTFYHIINITEDEKQKNIYASIFKEIVKDLDRIPVINHIDVSKLVSKIDEEIKDLEGDCFGNSPFIEYCEGLKKAKQIILEETEK